MVEDPTKRKTFKTKFYFRVKSVDVFNLQAIYRMMHEWFVEEEYCEDENKFPEVYMRDRNTQKRGREILVFWRFHKHPFGINFYNRTIDLLVKMVGLKEVEVVQEGKKFRFQAGTFEVKVWGYLEYDVEMKWRNHWLLKHFLDIYVNRVTNRDMESHREELLVEIESLQQAIKEYMNLMTHEHKHFNLKNVTMQENPYM